MAPRFAGLVGLGGRYQAQTPGVAARARPQGARREGAGIRAEPGPPSPVPHHPTAVLSLPSPTDPSPSPPPRSRLSPPGGGGAGGSRAPAPPRPHKGPSPWQPRGPQRSAELGPGAIEPRRRTCRYRGGEGWAARAGAAPMSPCPRACRAEGAAWGWGSGTLGSRAGGVLPVWGPLASLLRGRRPCWASAQSPAPGLSQGLAGPRSPSTGVGSRGAEDLHISTGLPSARWDSHGPGCVCGRPGSSES